MAMTQDQMKQMFAELTRQQGDIAKEAASVANAAAIEAASQAEKKQTIAMLNMEAINKKMMDAFMQGIREDKTTAAAEAATTTADKADRKYPSKLHENRIDPKQLNRVVKFEGGAS